MNKIKLLTKRPKENYDEITVLPHVEGYEWADDGEQIDSTIEIIQENGRTSRPDVIYLSSEDSLDEFISILKAAKGEFPALKKKAEAKIIKDRKARLRREAAKAKIVDSNKTKVANDN